jgi:hypothetical protein
MREDNSSKAFGRVTAAASRTIIAGTATEIAISGMIATGVKQPAREA